MSKTNLKFNYHSHSTYCDGRNSLEEMVQSSIEKGLSHFGFSAHAPIPLDNDFGLKYSEVDNYLRETRELKEKYKDQIGLYTSMEFDYLPKVSEDINERAEAYGLDYVIAAVHLVDSPNGIWFIDGSKHVNYDRGLKEIFGGDIQEAVKAFYHQTNEMIVNIKPDIVGHFDKIKMHNRNLYFQEDEPWYKKLVMETIDLIKEEDLIAEINTRGVYKKRSPDFFPMPQWVKRLAEIGARITISTDSHHKDEVDMLFQEACDQAKACGHKEVWYYDGEWKPEPL